MINDGISHVIDDNTYWKDQLYVRNVGCTSEDPSGGGCPFPGAPTAVEVTAGGEVNDLLVFDTSGIMINGGTVGGLDSFDAATITMDDGETAGVQAFNSSSVTVSGGMISGTLRGYEFSSMAMTDGTVTSYLDIGSSSTMTMTGGSVVGNIYANSSSTMTLSGGWVGGRFYASGDATLTIVGSDFKVNGIPVSCGDLTALVGDLTGTLASGHAVNNRFYQGGGDYTGTIRLIPEPTTALLVACGLVGLASRRWRAA